MKRQEEGAAFESAHPFVARSVAGDEANITLFDGDTNVAIEPGGFTVAQAKAMETLAMETLAKFHLLVSASPESV